MNELIKVTEKDGKQLVSARELHDYLGLDKSQWSRWYKTNIVDNPFGIEGVDYEGFDMMSNGNLTKNFALTLDFAKKLAMLSRTENGEKVRDYFIECERQSKQPFKIPKTYPEALYLAAQQAELIEAQQKELAKKTTIIEEQEPKVDFYDTIILKGKTVSVGEAAKLINVGLGQNKLFDFLRNEKVLMYNNVPYQKYIDNGCFTVVEKLVQKGKYSNVELKTMVCQKGIDFILKLCKEKLPK
jgi:anti-repressor protein